jgi:hypothetical protein
VKGNTVADPQQALATQLANIQKKTGKSLEQLKSLVAASGLQKHGQIRDMLKSELGLGHGDANTLTHIALNPGSETAAPASDDAAGDLERIYAGPKVGLRPLHDALMERIKSLGPFEIAPKKTYLSLRRKKQFAMLGPATSSQIEVGLNIKGVAATTRLLEVKQPAMCSMKLRVALVSEVDDELLGWLREAYAQAG